MPALLQAVLDVLTTVVLPALVRPKGIQFLE